MKKFVPLIIVAIMILAVVSAFSFQNIGNLLFGIQSNDAMLIGNLSIISGTPKTITPSTNGVYSYEVQGNGWKAYFRNNSNQASPVRFEKDGYYFIYDISGSNLQWHETPTQPSATSTLGSGYPSNSQNTIASVNGNKLSYNNAFATTNVNYEMFNGQMKETFVLNGGFPLKDYLYLEYTGHIEFNKSLQICANGVCYKPSGNQDNFVTSGKIEFKDSNNKTIFYLKEPTITDKNGNTISATYVVRGSDAQMNFWLRIPKSYLETAVYPILIDPTVEVYQEQKRLQYTFNEGIVDIYLNCTDVNSDNIFVKSNNGSWKFGADLNIENTSLVNCKYTLNSTKKLNLEEITTSNGIVYPVFYIGVQEADGLKKYEFNFSDIFTKDYSNIGGNYYINNWGYDDYSATINFITNSSIDPLITISSTSSSGSVGYNSVTYSRSGSVQAGKDTITNYVYRAWFQMDLSAVPNGTQVYSAVFNFTTFALSNSTGGQTNMSSACNLFDITTLPSSQTDSNLYSDIGGGTSYGNTGANCNPGTYSFNMSNSSQFIKDLMAGISRRWFAIGITGNEFPFSYQVNSFGSVSLDLNYTAPINISDCATLSTDNWAYNLTNNLSTSSGVCITISGNNITLDLNGYGINTTGNNLAYGVLITGQNNTVKNGMINAGAGVSLSGTTGNTLQNITIDALDGGKDVEITSSTDANCNNQLINVRDEIGNNISYYNSSVNLDGLNASSIIFCNADNSNLANLNISSGSLKRNSNIKLLRSNNVNITNLTMIRGINGIELTGSNFTINNATIINLSSNGISTTNTNEADNKYYNIFISSAYNGVVSVGDLRPKMENITVWNTTLDGFSITINGNVYGVVNNISIYRTGRYGLIVSGTMLYSNFSNIYIENPINIGFHTIGRFDNIENVTVINGTTRLFSMASAWNNKIKNITSIKSTSAGMYLSTGASNNSINGFYINNTLNGIMMLTSDGNYIANGTIESSRNDAIYFQTVPVYNNTLDNITILRTNSSWRDLNVVTAGLNYNYFIDTYFKNYTITSNSILSFKNSKYGKIDFLAGISGTGNNLTYDISILNNSAFVNSSQTGLNKSANITFYGLPNNFLNPVIIYNGNITCNSTTSPTCSNFTSLNAGTVIFNVSSWSNYSILDIDIFAPNVTFNSQNPPDLNLTNFLGTDGVNITYNISDETSLNISTIKLFYKSNSTESNVMYYQNGTSHIGYFSNSYNDNSSATFRWNLLDNAILTGTYNYGEITMENTNHSSASLSNQNTYLAVELLNVSNTTRYSFFEIMSNRSAGSGALRYYYCNSSYPFSTGSTITTNTNCINFFSQTNNTYDHRHTSFSAHMVAPMAIVNGSVGNIKVTSTSYFLIRGNTGTTVWDYYNISNSSRTNATRTTTTGGNTWSTQTYTVDSHLHQFGINYSIWYYACANDTSNNQNCSNPRQDLFGLSGLPPISPSVYSPTNNTYSGNININYTESFSPNGYEIIYYNISLLNNDSSFNKTIIGNNSLNLSYIWSSIGTADGEYIISVQVYDNMSQSSIGYSENFTINNAVSSNIGGGSITEKPSNESLFDIFNLNRLFENCSTDFNNAFLDMYVPAFNIKKETITCSEIDSQRWFLRIEQSAGFYYYKGIKIWILLTILALAILVLYIRFHKKFKKFS